MASPIPCPKPPPQHSAQTEGATCKPQDPGARPQPESRWGRPGPETQQWDLPLTRQGDGVQVAASRQRHHVDANLQQSLPTAVGALERGGRMGSTRAARVRRRNHFLSQIPATGIHLRCGGKAPWPSSAVSTSLYSTILTQAMQYSGLILILSP